MKRETFFLKLSVIAFGLLVLGLCIFALPAGIVTDKVGYYRPILFGLYVPAIPFFFAIYQALVLLGNIDRGTAFSERSVKALKYIKYCGLAISGLFLTGMPYIYYAADRDDAPGVVAICLIIVIISFAVAMAGGVFQRLVQNAVDIKSENDLTV